MTVLVLSDTVFFGGTMSKKATTTSEFWLPPDLDPADFEKAFKSCFRGGVAKHIPLVPDAHPWRVPDGSHYFELTLPTSKMARYQPFLLEYARKHRVDVTKFPASGFGFAHSG